jgi:putative heme-binding domain-containing protein
MSPSLPAGRFVGLLFAAALIAVGAAIAGAQTAADIQLPPGFHAELVYTVPLSGQGSWVSLTVDDRGRIIASDQYGSLYRVEPSPLGEPADKTRVEQIPMSVGMAQGMQVVDGKLYVVQNGAYGAFSSGVYRLSDNNGDDRFDRVEQLRVFQGEGEHGPHAVVLGPDRKSLYFVCGNYTALPAYNRTLVPAKWAEDQLLPRIFDPMGHANELHPPGGWVARTDLDGKNLEIVSVGYRNAYDLAFNADGELFTYDSDMEWDIGTPWYRPTRVCHVTSGSEWGWRSGNGPWPPYFPDTLPPVVEVGPGSPTGMAFGAGTKFPERYQQALFGGDWSYGNLYAFHLTPDGSSYRGEVERFASAMPLAVTDIVVRPQDGALYFAVGGRQSQSALFRIVADESTAIASDSSAGLTAASATPAAKQSADVAPPVDTASAVAARQVRHDLEKFHTGPAAGAVDAAWPHLASRDRFIRFAARTAIEHQPVDQWKARALPERSATARIQALIALARCGTNADQSAWLTSLLGVKFADLGRDARLNLLRAAALGVMRFDPWPESARQQLLDAFNPHYPTDDHLVDRELANLLVRLNAPDMIERLLGALERAATQEEAIDAAQTLSVITTGWTVPQRTRLLDWFDKAASLGGGRSSFGYIVGARNRFIARFTPSDRGALIDRISKPLVASTGPVTVEARPFVKEWKLDELVPLIDGDAADRDFENGRRMFSAAQCYNCHRIAGEGSSVGPDLTGVGRRFGVADILRAIVEPSHEISDQYRQIVFDVGGRTIIGRVTNLNADSVFVSTDMLDPKKEIAIRRDEIDDQEPSPTSIMPAGLLNTLNEDEVRDLIAYLRRGGAAPAPAPAPSAPPATSSVPATATSAEAPAAP